MGIYEPQPKLSATERALLLLLARLAVSEPVGSTNLPSDRAVLSEKEAVILLKLLEEFSTSKKFVESAYFVESMSQTDLAVDGDVREIYLSWRKFYGRSRSMASTHWHSFLRRIGRDRIPYGYVRSIGASPYEMSYAHFRNMESLLLSRSGVGERVKSLILAVIDKYENETNAARRGDLPLASGSILKIPRTISNSIESELKIGIGSPAISSTQAAGLMTVITDVSVLFTTRDWGVAGTISTIAGGFAASVYPQK